MKFPARLHELRKASGLTQSALGALVGLTSKQIQRYESGDSEPTLSKLIALSSVFQVSLDYLVGLTD